MEQLTQNLKDGEMTFMEVPFPALQEGYLLVRNHFSLISAGTEGKTVKDARLSYIGKAMERKEEVRKVIQTARTFGVMNTFRMVMNKLESPIPLGYCSSGEVIEVSPQISDIKAGDLVACGGNSANHAEVISVPRNLCVKLPSEVSTESACVTTMGAVALQGIRQADLRLGENCAVIGLGLLGQLTMQLLEASGVKAIGIDIDQNQVELAIQHSGIAFNRTNEYLQQAIQNATGGNGVDAVIITAAATSDDPVNLAGEICRQKGKVIIVGAVPTGFKRTDYFRKELDLRMSCSYGPGRYDTNYEEMGVDYPIGYVRWTENRNMQAFVELIRTGKVQPEKFISHKFKFKDAFNAYDLILNRKNKFSGIILEYNTAKKFEKLVHVSHPQSSSASEPVIGLLGAGSFAQNIMLPSLKGLARFRGIATSKPLNAKNISTKFGFELCTGNSSELFADPQINTIMIATRHDSHAHYVLQSLLNNKNVFVEKPLCLNEKELSEIKNTYYESGKTLMVGFNRRFAPLIKILKSEITKFKGEAISINYRINAGTVPPNHWVNNKQQGGGRVIGEVCHFVDLCTHLTGSPAISVSAIAINDVYNLHDTVSVSLQFSNGSIATISYFSNGNNKVGKELLEVFFGGNIAVLDDFTSLKISGKLNLEKKVKIQDKGHKNEFKEFLKSIKEGQRAPISFEEQYLSMITTFKIMESIQHRGERIFIDPIL